MTGIEQTPPRMTPNAALGKTMAGLLVSSIFLLAVVLLAAGRLDWKLGWLFAGIWILLKVVFLLLLRWHDPDLLIERATRHKNAQPYDRIVLPVYFILSFGTIFLAALDGGRLGWSGEISVWLILAAYMVYLLGNGLAGWAAAANPYFSSESRLQTERRQTAVANGPYRFIRHPAYLAAIVLWPPTGLLMGSWWAVIPGLLASLMMFIRAIFEDEMLQRELPGYQEYARKVPYRLLPGIW